jgi:hypothetical protein
LATKIAGLIKGASAAFELSADFSMKGYAGGYAGITLSNGTTVSVSGNNVVLDAAGRGSFFSVGTYTEQGPSPGILNLKGITMQNGLNFVS